ncbi:hypothetical protein AB48_2997 [Escherichia coli 3-475-03_S1_C2]|nr:hypothetical protein AB48_2997 [Escherichia coli 3-475-03_S1_C2]
MKKAWLIMRTKKSPTVVKSNARILTAKKISQHRLAYGNKR